MLLHGNGVAFEVEIVGYDGSHTLTWFAPWSMSKCAGLQVADAVTSGLFAAVNVNRYGNTEDRYAKLIWPTFYRHKGVFFGYGLKFWPDNFAKLKEANPHLAVFASGD